MMTVLLGPSCHRSAIVVRPILFRRYTTTPVVNNIFRFWGRSYDEVKKKDGDFEHTLVPEADHPYYENTVRHPHIQVHPRSVGRRILPGNWVISQSRSGRQQLKPLEINYGYFWMMFDIEATKEKPTVSNETLIPKEEALVFSKLENLQTLTSEWVQLPDFVLEERAPYTLVVVSFREFGNQHLTSWIDPLKKALPDLNLVRLVVTEGWVSKYLLRWAVTSGCRRNIPEDEHDKTLMYFGSDPLNWRDELRMHNMVVGYVFLLDADARVRFAGSGPATEEEVDRLIGFAKELAPTKPKKKSQRRRGRR